MMNRNSKHPILGLCIILFFFVFFTAVASATTLYVGPGEANTTIGEAVSAAHAGDTIIVRDGTYTENVDVDKRLTIRSENGSALTIVNASNSGDHVFEVTADYVNITGFTVKNATGQENKKAGIYLDKVEYCSILNNNLTDNNNAIYLDKSNYTEIANNTASLNNRYGIGCADHSSHNIITNNTAYNNARGIYLDQSTNNSLTLNNFSNNNDYGISLDHSTNNTISGNIINNNSHGIWIDGDNNQIFGNDILNNSASEGSGIHRKDHVSGNVIYFNNIVGNSPAGSGSYGVYNENETAETVDAENNWWGSASGPYHPTTNPTGEG